MTKRTKEILDRLDEAYTTEYKCYLNHETPWQLLIATMLSAQCTDARVNIVTKDLFVKYPTLQDFANADLKELEQDIHSTGFYHNKAKNIIACSKDLLEKFDGEVPRSIEELTSLAGVGRKTANLVVGDIYGKPAVVVDTHCIRITSRLGFHNTKDAAKIERILRLLLPPERSNDFCHRLVLHGRAVCKARNPECNDCCLKDICDHYNNITAKYVPRL